VKILKRWLLSPEHYDFPYPNEEEKKRLAEITGISVKQLNTWFTNSRKRYVPRAVCLCSLPSEPVASSSLVC
jgi:hypothetical protein